MSFNKKILAVTALAGVVIASHAAFWIYESAKIKTSIEQLAGRISKEIGKKNTELLFAKSEISGYPLHFVVKLSQPRITSTSGGEKLELSSLEEKLLISTNLIGTNYKVILPANIDIKKTINEQERAFKLEFVGAGPNIDLKLAGNVLSIGENVDVMQYINENIKEVSYADAGYSLVNNDGGAKISSSGGSVLKITQNKNAKNNIETAYNIKLDKLDAAAFFADSEKLELAGNAGALWPLNASVDLLSVEERDDSGKSKSVDFLVNGFDVTAATFGVGAKGEIKANGEDIFPFGNLSLKLTNYQGLVDYFSGIVKHALAETKIPFFNIQSDKSIEFKKLLLEVASEKSNGDKDILVNLTREKGKSLFIGQKGLMEVIDMLKAGAHSAEQSGNATSLAKPAKDAAPGVTPQILNTK
jgi:hypothetical protein